MVTCCQVILLVSFSLALSTCCASPMFGRGTMSKENTPSPPSNYPAPFQFFTGVGKRHIGQKRIRKMLHKKDAAAATTTTSSSSMPSSYNIPEDQEQPQQSTRSNPETGGGEIAPPRNKPELKPSGKRDYDVRWRNTVNEARVFLGLPITRHRGYSAPESVSTPIQFTQDWTRETAEGILQLNEERRLNRNAKTRERRKMWEQGDQSTSSNLQQSDLGDQDQEHPNTSSTIERAKDRINYEYDDHDLNEELGE